MAISTQQPTVTTPARFVTKQDITAWMEYERSDGALVQLSVATGGIDITGQPYPSCLSIAIYPEGDGCEEITLSLAEARMLRDLLNRPESAVILENE